jgi:proteasome lid subunit RPN8/RPN11
MKGDVIMSDIVLTLEHRQAIARSGEASYPLESRGLLLGYRNGRIKQVVDLVVVDAASESTSQGDRYHIPSLGMQEAAEIARAKELEIIGSFFSYADQPAKPSIHDRDDADPAFSYVIVGIRQGRAHELTAWRLSEDRSAFLQEIICSS